MNLNLNLITVDQVKQNKKINLCETIAAISEGHEYFSYALCMY
jgi:hypothetical protein